MAPIIGVGVKIILTWPNICKSRFFLFSGKSPGADESVDSFYSPKDVPGNKKFTRLWNDDSKCNNDIKSEYIPISISHG